MLRLTHAISVDNFQAQAGTACFGVQLQHGGTSSGARFVLADRGDSMGVIAGSLAWECECPDPDFERPCQIR